MQTKVKGKRKAAVVQEDCVACGCCMKICPRSAINIVKGIFAEVEFEKCIGCSKCVKECPASIITITEVPA
ncbi:MAG: DUF362 domain-containing protein [Eubacteriales bacterium]